MEHNDPTATAEKAAQQPAADPAAADTAASAPAPDAAKTADAAKAAAPDAADTADTAKEPADKAADTKKDSAAEKGKKGGQKAAAAADAAAELARTKDLFLRTAAEYDNYRKRTTREREAAFGNGVMHAVQRFLPLVDTLEIATNAQTADANYKKGVQMTLEKAYAVLRELGLEEIPAQGQPFDPQLHEAVLRQSVPETASGTVVQVLQKGYTLNGRVVRHAMVAVSE